jgi:hypothetical protein
MGLRGYRVGLPTSLTFLFFVLLACGGKTFETVLPEEDGGIGDGGPPADAPGDAVGSNDGGGPNDSGGPNDGAGSDGGTDAGACPIPATIANGAMCATPGLDCMSAAPIYTCGSGTVVGYGSCTCAMGVWSCPDQATCVEAGAPPPTCPAPRLVHEAVPCDTPGEDCPGNPTMCSSQTTFYVYDDFQCTKLMVWTRIVATVCADGG